MKVAFLGFREALAYAWQKEYITEPERSKENGFAQSLPHSPPLIGNGDWRLNGVPPRHTKAYSLKKVFHFSATLDRDKFMKAPLVLLTALFIASAHQTLSGETSGDWTYSVSDNQATITGYSGAGGAVDIPAVVNEISVVKVGDGSPPIFGNGNTTVTSVTIPDSVTSIGVDAFLDCTSLESVTIPDSVTSMGDYAFYVCTSLTSVTIGNSVESIGDYAFGNCPKLTSVTIGNSVESIGDFAFLDCSSLTSITIPDSVTSIGEAAFDSCTSLTSLTIGNSVMSIGEDAFGGCSSLASITIPDSVTSIGDYAFLGCTILTSITVDAGNSNYSSVDGVLFNKLQTLLIQYPAAILDDSYTIPDGVTSIGAGAFLGCTSLTSITVDAGNSNYSSVDGVLFNKLQTLLIQYPAGILDDSYTIPDSVTSIGVAAFADCTAVTSVTIPDSVMSIGDYAFADCNNLISVTILGSVTIIGDQAFDSCTSLASVTIPDSVTSIGGDAFYGCTSLTSVTLPILFSDSYPSFSLSSEQVLLYGSPVARDVPLSNNFTAGQNDVTSDPATYSLYTASDVSTAESVSRILGQQDVTASPSVYDLHTSTELAEATAAARTIVNVSARVNLGAEETVIPGFVVLGESKQLLIRAIGPKLADLGVPSPLPDPTMTIYRTRYDGQPNDVVAIIDDWKADGADVAAINAAMATARAFPLEPVADFQGNPLPTDDTKSAATLITLSVGVYTVVVTSADGGEGDVLVEAYEVY
jgi:hypothetical protein